MRFWSAIVLASVLGVLGTACSRSEQAAATAAQAAVSADKCEHGVKKSLCTRCNPKLEAVFKAKGDWCEEHRRPESQCALCKPGLAKEGIK